MPKHMTRQQWADYWNEAGDRSQAAGNDEHANYYHYYGDQNQNAATREGEPRRT